MDVGYQQGGRGEPVTEGQRSKAVARWNLLTLCWVLALGVHLAWVPNLVWFMVVSPEPEATVQEVALVTMPVRPAAPPSEGRAAAGRIPPEIELPGAAPGSRADQVAATRLERDREAQRRTQSWAQRALDQADEPQPFRPHRRGATRSPSRDVSITDPDDDDIDLNGQTSRPDSLLRRRGESLTGEPTREPGAGGSPSEGNRVPLGEGELNAASAGQGEGESPRVARRGARPRAASPQVREGAPSAEALYEGNLAGMVPSRTATPALAWSEPVHEPRVASGPDVTGEHGANRPRRPGPGGISNGTQGPGHEGRGRGASGVGRTEGSIEDDYGRQVGRLIRRHWRDFPRRLAFNLQQGETVIWIWIREDGQIDRVRVQSSSGHDAFDNLAVRAAYEAGPLPPPPPDVLRRSGRGYFLLALPMRYRNPMFE